jgi:hypothetical protein
MHEALGPVIELAAQPVLAGFGEIRVVIHNGLLEGGRMG